MANGVRLERRDPPGAPPDPSCVALRNSGRTRGPCTRTRPADRVDTPGTGTARSQPPGTRRSGSRETAARQSAADLDHHACQRPASGTSRNDRAPVGATRLVRLGAVDNRRTQSPRRQQAQASCPTAQRCGINRLPNSLECSIAEISIATATARRKICDGPPRTGAPPVQEPGLLPGALSPRTHVCGIR